MNTGRRPVGEEFPHVRALRALGLIDGDGEGPEGPESWPAWTDAHTYTVTR